MISLSAVGLVRSSRTDIDNDFDWDSVPARIELDAAFSPDALLGIEDFSHAEVLYLMDRIPEEKVERATRHPRGNPAWPKIGIFAQRGAARPNRIAATIVRLVRCEGRVLHVTGLDALDGSPVLDIKPVMREFLPRTEVRQPNWASELMTGYWRKD